MAQEQVRQQNIVFQKADSMGDGSYFCRLRHNGLLRTNADHRKTQNAPIWMAWRFTPGQSPSQALHGFATLIFGKLSDIYGRRIMLLVSVIFCTTGTSWRAQPQFCVLIVAGVVSA